MAIVAEHGGAAGIENITRTVEDDKIGIPQDNIAVGQTVMVVCV